MPDTFKHASLRVAALHTWWDGERQQEQRGGWPASESLEDRLEFRRCGGSTVPSPPAIAHDMLVSPGFAHKHPVGCRQAEDLGRMQPLHNSAEIMRAKATIKAKVQFIGVR